MIDGHDRRALRIVDLDHVVDPDRAAGRRRALAGIYRSHHWPPIASSRVRHCIR